MERGFAIMTNAPSNPLSNPSANGVLPSIGLGGAQQTPMPEPTPVATGAPTPSGPNPLSSMGSSFSRVMKGGTASIAHDVRAGAQPKGGARSTADATKAVIGGLAQGVTVGAGAVGLGALGLGALKGPEAATHIGQTVAKGINAVTTRLTDYRSDPGMASASRQLDTLTAPATEPSASAEQDGPSR